MHLISNCISIMKIYRRILDVDLLTTLLLATLRLCLQGAHNYMDVSPDYAWKA